MQLQPIILKSQVWSGSRSIEHALESLAEERRLSSEATGHGEHLDWPAGRVCNEARREGHGNASAGEEKEEQAQVLRGSCQAGLCSSHVIMATACLPCCQAESLQKEAQERISLGRALVRAADKAANPRPKAKAKAEASKDGSKPNSKPTAT